MGEREDRLGWVGATLADRFAVEAIAGEGGFGVVYRGKHLGFDEPVAIKCLKLPAELTDGERDKFLSSFRDEARLLHRLSRQSTGIVQALDVGAATSPRGIWAPYIVMEWLQGRSLAAELGERARAGGVGISLSEALELLAPAADALAVAHESGVAHLDVKPGNLFLTRAGKERRLKVLDFGIAKVLTENDTLTGALSRSGAAVQVCTPHYAAPEQFNKKHGPTGPWTDVFALALVLIEVLTGKQVLDGQTVLQLYVASVSQHARPSLREQGVAVSMEVEQVLQQALQAYPKRRFSDAGSMWRALSEAAASSKSQESSLEHVAASQRQPLSDVASATAPTLPLEPGLSMQNRVCTVVFAELSGPRELWDEIDPELRSRHLDRSFDALSACVQALGGSTERLIGDTLMAIFGLKSDAAPAAERAVQAALRMMDALADLAAPRRGLDASLRIGINTGRVFVSAGSDARLTVSGGAVKLAARLQQAAASAAILVARDTHREVVGLYKMEPTLLAAGSGDTGMQKAYRVIGPAPDRHALDLAQARAFMGFETRFVGRAVEVEALDAIADGVRREGSARIVTLVGRSGVGKSRLLVEIGDQLREQGFFVMGAQASSLSAQRSYALAASLFRTRFHIHEDEPADVCETKLRRAIRMLRGSDEPVAAVTVVDGRPIGVLDEDEAVTRLSVMLGVRAEGRPDTVVAEDRSAQAKHRIASAVAGVLRAARRPLALLCDDVHWADPASLALFDDLLTRAGDVSLLLVCTAETSMLPEWADDTRKLRIDVEPLARRHLEAMARDRLRKVDADVGPLAEKLADRAEGSPLTLVESLHLLVDAGVVDAPDEGGWQVDLERMGELRLPTSVQGLVQARLDRLEPDALAVLCRAAVVGTTFWDGALAGPGIDAAKLPELIEALCARRLVQPHPTATFPDEKEYAFAERATQQVAYDMLGHSARRELHRRAAEWLEARTPGDANASLVARHYEQAGALARAVDAYARAANHAATLGQQREALHSFEQACRLDSWLAGESEPPSTAAGWEEVERGHALEWQERVRLQLGRGDALRKLGRLDEAHGCYLEVAPLLPGEEVSSVARLRWSSRIAHRRALVEVLQGKLDEPRALVECAIEDATVGGLVEERAEMWSLLAELRRRARDPDETRAAALAGLRVLRGATQRSPAWRQAASKLLVILGGAFHVMGKLVRAERCYLQASRLIDERDNPDQMSRALNNVAGMRFFRGDLGGARQAFLRALALTERSGDLWMTMTALANLGEVEHRLENPAVAKGYLREAVRLGEQIRAGGDLADCYRNLAAVCFALGEHTQALDEARRALERAQAGGAQRLYLDSVLATLVEILIGLEGSGARRDELAPRLEAVARTLDALTDLDDASTASVEQARAALTRLRS